MDANWPVTLHDLGNAAYDAFLWPGKLILSQVGTYAPELSLQSVTGVEGDGILLTAIVSLMAWSLLGVAAWKTVKTVCAQIYYGACRVRTHLLCQTQRLNRRRMLSQPVEIPEVEFDELDIAVLNTGATLPQGFPLTAVDLSGPLTNRPVQVQRSLDKLRKYGLVDDMLGTTGGFDNYRLTRTGAALLSMWNRQDIVPQ